MYKIKRIFQAHSIVAGSLHFCTNVKRPGKVFSLPGLNMFINLISIWLVRHQILICGSLRNPGY